MNRNILSIFLLVYSSLTSMDNTQSKNINTRYHNLINKSPICLSNNEKRMIYETYGRIAQKCSQDTDCDEIELNNRFQIFENKVHQCRLADEGLIDLTICINGVCNTIHKK